MPIRHVEIKSALSYDDKKALEEETGQRIGYPRASHDRNNPLDFNLSIVNGSQEHLGFYHVALDETSHKGRVVAIEIDRGVRIMSDVWADLTFAVLYEPTGEHTGCFSTETDWASRDENGKYGKKHKGACGMFRRVCIANSDTGESFHGFTRAQVDAPAWLQEVYEAWKAGRDYAEAIRRYDRQQAEIQRERRFVEKGKLVRVTRGRKVPKGTEGIVFWEGDSQWGTKVGIALPQEDGTYRKEKRTGRYGKVYDSYADVVWTYAKNCEVISELGGRIL